jgi:gentisate 1,2-dioxygenase
VRVVKSGKSDQMDVFYRDLARKNMDALWRGRPPSQGHRDWAAPYPPCHWQWTDIRGFMDQAGKLVTTGPDAERRVVQLIHPELVAVRSASHTLTANVQMVLPGEIAPSHRHVTGAIRFIIEGEAAITIVEGEPVEMRPGDLVLTPGWHWHGHINESGGPMLWMDTLDRPITAALRQVRQEPYESELQAVTRPKGYSAALYGAGHLRPVGVKTTAASPLFSYPWAKTEAALHQLSKVEGDPFDDVVFDYINPTTGGQVLPTIGCRIQMLRRGVHTKAHRHAHVSVCHAFRGSGATVVDGVEMAWKQGDFFVIPPYAWHEHVNESSEDAVVFSTTDLPVLEALHLMREEAFQDNGGHQQVTGSYAEVYAGVPAGPGA